MIVFEQDYILPLQGANHTGDIQPKALPWAMLWCSFRAFDSVIV